VAAADFVLLGEYHDNAVQHSLRGALISASKGRAPAIVFEQFPRTDAPMPLPAPGEDITAWLDSRGFDRKGWKWPMHAPVVEAAIARARGLWGSGLSREAVHPVFLGGAAAAPTDLRLLMEQSPLDSAGRAAVDQELIEGHCGKLPVSMIPGMRAAQEVRDASMTAALLAAGAGGPAWLIAGNGHVRLDMGVPRMLRNAAPGRKILSVGLLERGADGAMPDAAARLPYDLVIVTPPAVREDPCASLGSAPGTPSTIRGAAR
jgi:uncharacterized iron-regulated protein